MTIDQLAAQWLSRTDFRTWDPYDIWTPKLALRAKQSYYTGRISGKCVSAGIQLLDLIAGPYIRRLLFLPRVYPSVVAQHILSLLVAFEATCDASFLAQARREWLLLEKLAWRCGDALAWGLPMDWMSSQAFYPAGTPFVTQTSYAMEAAAYFYLLTGDTYFQEVAKRIGIYLLKHIHTSPGPKGGVRCSYGPNDRSYVYNAAAYRALCLFLAHRLTDLEAEKEALHSLEYVLAGQNADGSWYYGEGDSYRYVDHYHTAFVLKNLLKLDQLLGGRMREVRAAIQRGFRYYCTMLFYRDDLLPKPFSIEPRKTYFYLDGYDLAEAFGLAVLLRALSQEGRCILRPREHAFMEAISATTYLKVATHKNLFLWRRVRGLGACYRNYLRWAASPHLLYLVIYRYGARLPVYLVGEG